MIWLQNQKSHKKLFLLLGVFIPTVLIFALLTLWAAKIINAQYVSLLIVITVFLLISFLLLAQRIIGQPDFGFTRIFAGTATLNIKNERRAPHEEIPHKPTASDEEASYINSVFLANMCHEIRTPLSSIIGFSELALYSDTSKAMDYLKKIKISSDWLLQIINDVIDISKIEAARMELENIPFNLHELFTNCRTIAEPNALEKGIMLYCYAEPSIDRILLGDPTKLRHVIINLLSNAIKFTNTGFVKLTSTAGEIAEDKITIYFEVSDSGIGMSPEQIKRIFEPYMQADSSTPRKFGGSGLGLSIAKNLIELMGGGLSVESIPGAGSRFFFDLSFGMFDKTEEIDETPKSEYIKPLFSGQVLICEDNILNQQVLSEHLAMVGLESTVARDGVEGVKYVRQRMENKEKPFDLIFMDIHMPHMDGLEAAEKLIELGNQSPVIALTADIMVNESSVYRRYGINDMISKPFTAYALWECIHKYLPSLQSSDDMENVTETEELQKKLRAAFLEDNKTTFADILAAIESGDIKQAYRYVHTLKSVARLIRLNSLSEAAKEIELSLSEETARYTDSQMQRLETELENAIRELTPVHPNDIMPTRGALSGKEDSLALLDSLDPLLKAGDTDCLDMVESLWTVPGSEKLVEQIEHFDFVLAQTTLNKLKHSLEREI